MNHLWASVASMGLFGPRVFAVLCPDVIGWTRPMNIILAVGDGLLTLWLPGTFRRASEYDGAGGWSPVDAWERRLRRPSESGAVES